MVWHVAPLGGRRLTLRMMDYNSRCIVSLVAFKNCFFFTRRGRSRPDSAAPAGSGPIRKPGRQLARWYTDYQRQQDMTYKLASPSRCFDVRDSISATYERERTGFASGGIALLCALTTLVFSNPLLLISYASYLKSSNQRDCSGITRELGQRIGLGVKSEDPGKQDEIPVRKGDLYASLSRMVSVANSFCTAIADPVPGAPPDLSSRWSGK